MGELMTGNGAFAALSNALNGVELDALPILVAGKLVEALSDAAGTAVRLDVAESSPASCQIGDPIDDAGSMVTFEVEDGTGRLSFEGSPRLSAAERRMLAGRLGQIWRVLEARARQDARLSKVQFHLQGLEQMAATIAVVRDVGETEKLVLDSAREIFFAWWAVLYRSVDGEFRSSRAVSVQAPIDPHRILAEPLSGVMEAGNPVIVEHPAARSDALPEPPAVLIPLHLSEGDHGLIALGSRMTGDPYTPDDLGLLGALAHNTTVGLRNAELVRDLKRAATIDPLTTCLNRRGFDSRLSIELNRAERYDRPLSLILLDIDDFKTLNDHYGHPAGDAVLQSLGMTFKERIRDTDIASRFGGEEFAIILPETEAETATGIAERLRIAIETLDPPGVVPGPITASFGVADYPARSDNEETLVRAADQALYVAKQSGRNRVSSAA